MPRKTAPPLAPARRPLKEPPPPKRPAPKGAAPKGAAPKQGVRRTRAAPGPGLGRRLGRVLLAYAAGLVAGVCVVGGVLWHDARTRVRAQLAEPLWELPGRVWSAPVNLWPGLTLTPEELAVDLQGAGYARVEQAVRPGDFQVSADSVLIKVQEATSPGGAVPAADALVTFADGRVRSVSPRATLVLPPSLLSTVRGADNELRSPRTLEDFPEHLVHAVLAMEDATFWEHHGLSPFGIARALVVNGLAGQTVQGGSTLTQQLAKNLFLSPDRTLARKVDEALLAMALEAELSKPEILTLYLNEIYWGQAGSASICGADEAARAFFGKPATRLDLSEAATLAGIISSPNAYSPLRNPDRATERRDLALKRLQELGWATDEAVRAALAAPLVVNPTPVRRSAPYAVSGALTQATELLGDEARRMEVHTTIQPALQRLAERVVEEGLARLEAADPGLAGVQAALVAVRPGDGAVVALVGGRDWGTSQFDRALEGARQPGSTVKPLVMLTAFERHPDLGPATLLDDAPIERRVDGRTWRPTNYDGQFVGPVPVREAIAKSRNVPAVLLSEQVGLAALQDALRGLGLSGATKLPSAALGAFEASPVELAGAYTVFPGRGRVAHPVLVRAVRDGSRAVYDAPAERARVASPRASVLATSVLTTVLQEGTGRGAAQHGLADAIAAGVVAGKTGTTDDARDAWFAGFTPELVVVVWVGFDQGRPLGLTGGEAALPLWSAFVAGSGTARGAFPRSDAVVTADACLAREGFACTRCEPELFSAGQAPPHACGASLAAPAAKVMDRVATVLERLRGEDPEVPQPESPTEEPRGRRRGRAQD